MATAREIAPRQDMRAIVLLATVAAALAGTTPEGLAYLKQKRLADGVVADPSGMLFKVLKSGPPGGKSPGRGDPCVCHYTGTLTDGTVFDSSVERRRPATFAPNQVIKGWTIALQLMHEGDKWELYIPSELAYGDRATGRHITAGAVLIFTIELIKVKEPSALLIPGTPVDLANPMHLMLVAYAVYILWGWYGGSGASAAAGPPISPDGVAAFRDNVRCFFDIECPGAGGEPATKIGRVEFELFKQVVPRTVENFRCLCTGERGDGPSGKPLHYRGTPFHRIIPDFMCQGGDTTRGDGTGGEHIYTSKFPKGFLDEFKAAEGYVPHSRPGLLSMANAGPNTNGSQFFLTTQPAPHLNGKHVVFGQVADAASMAVVKEVERYGSGNGSPRRLVRISDCGEIGGKKSE